MTNIVSSVSDLLSFTVKHHIGDFSGLIGLLLTVIGFILTIKNVREARSAAQEASRAVNRVRRVITDVNTVAEVSALVAGMEEIRRLHRVKQWHLLPDRYSTLKKALISVKASRPDMTDERKTIIQGAVQHISGMEQVVEKAIANGGDSTKVLNMNRTLSNQIDALNGMLVQIKLEMENDHDEPRENC